MNKKDCKKLDPVGYFKKLTSGDVLTKLKKDLDPAKYIVLQPFGENPSKSKIEIQYFCIQGQVIMDDDPQLIKLFTKEDKLKIDKRDITLKIDVDFGD